MNEKLPVDVKGFAEALGVEESTAYGFLRLLAEMKLVETSKRPQPEGKKGKPATLYLLTAEVGPKLVALLSEKMQQLRAATPAPVAAPATTPATATVTA